MSAVAEESAVEGDTFPRERLSQCAGCLCRCFQALNQLYLYCAGSARLQAVSGQTRWKAVANPVVPTLMCYSLTHRKFKSSDF